MRNLPKGWAWTTLGELGSWHGGGTPSKRNPTFWEGGIIPWLSPKDMGDTVIKGTQDRITEAAVGKSATSLIPANSVVVVVRSGILERTVPVGLVPFETTLNQDMKGIAPYPGVDPRWLLYTVQSQVGVILGTCRKDGTTVASLDTTKFQALPIPVPPPAEQHRIVETLEDHLSRLDAAEQYLQSVVSMLRNMDRSALDQCFGRREIVLANLIEGISAGKSFGGANTAARDDEWGIIKVSAMTWGEFLPSENKAVPADRVDPRFEIHEGDLLVSRANTADYVGASVLVGQVRPKLLLSDKSLRIIPRPGVHASWLWRALQAPSARRQMSDLATGTKDSMRNISQESLRRILLPKADDAEQSEAIQSYGDVAGAIRRMRAEVAVLQSRSAALRRSLLSAAFNGQLVDQDPNDEPATVALERLRAEVKPARKRATKRTAVTPTRG